MSVTYDVDPTAIRISLERSRRWGAPFAEAWERATETHRSESDDEHLLAFMRKHFEAAYNADSSERGRCLVPPRDVSSAVPVRDYKGRYADRNADILAERQAGRTLQDIADAFGLTPQHVGNIVKLHALPVAQQDSERCRSGDDCDRLAVRGRFGKMWCEHHATELERLAGQFAVEKHERDPRQPGGGLSIRSRKRAA